MLHFQRLQRSHSSLRPAHSHLQRPQRPQRPQGSLDAHVAPARAVAPASSSLAAAAHAPPDDTDEAGEVPQATRKLDKKLAKTIEIGDMLEARFPPDNKWGAVLTVEAER